MNFNATKARVSNRGCPSDSFLTELVSWGRKAPDDIFTPRPDDKGETDIYTSVKPQLGPWTSPPHRRAAMLEVMRVLGGFESTWDWSEGRDTTNSTSVTPATIEAGLWQVSYNSVVFGQDLKALCATRVISGGNTFQETTKSDHAFAMEYIARLLRHTARHNGPVLRHEIHPFLSRASVKEFETLLS